MKAAVDASLCNGCGICEIVCPEVFRMSGGNETGLAVVRGEVVPEEAIRFCRDARDCCKPRAISLSDDETQPRFPARRTRLRVQRVAPGAGRDATGAGLANLVGGDVSLRRPLRGRESDPIFRCSQKPRTERTGLGKCQKYLVSIWARRTRAWPSWKAASRRSF